MDKPISRFPGVGVQASGVRWRAKDAAENAVSSSNSPNDDTPDLLRILLKHASGLSPVCRRSPAVALVQLA